MSRYFEMIPASFKAKDVITGTELEVKSALNIPGSTAMILEVE